MQPVIWNLTFGRLKKDLCQPCRTLTIAIKQADPNEGQVSLNPKLLFDEHLTDAAFKYQFTAHYMNVAIDSFADIQLGLVLNNSTYRDTSQYIQFDADQNYPEIWRREGPYYFKSPLNTHTLSTLFCPAPNGRSKGFFIYSEMVGAKKMENVIECLSRGLEEFNVGAAHLFWHCDSALRTYKFYMWLAWGSHSAIRTDFLAATWP